MIIEVWQVQTLQIRQAVWNPGNSWSCDSSLKAIKLETQVRANTVVQFWRSSSSTGRPTPYLGEVSILSVLPPDSVRLTHIIEGKLFYSKCTNLNITQKYPHRNIQWMFDQIFEHYGQAMLAHKMNHCKHLRTLCKTKEHDNLFIFSYKSFIYSFSFSKSSI